jgi:hypothetical protein
MDIRLHCEDAAMALVDQIPGAHQTDAWFYESSEMGALVRRFRSAVEAQDLPFKGSAYSQPLISRTARPEHIEAGTGGHALACSRTGDGDALEREWAPALHRVLPSPATSLRDVPSLWPHRRWCP